jgi:sulfonate transport system substrate-binding protein
MRMMERDRNPLQRSDEGRRMTIEGVSRNERRQRMKTLQAILIASLGVAIALVAVGIPAATAVSLPRDEPLAELRIGFQKGGPLMILKSSGELDRRLGTLGVHVQWAEFPSGPPLLEALNAGALELGVAGNAATVFAQGATDSQLVYLAVSVPNPHGDAMLVPKDSPIRTLADLKGKTIAYTRGSNAQYFLIRALEHAKIDLSEVRPAGLSPTDARAAFESGSVDAWVIWDPFYADAQLNLHARVLVDGTGLVDDSVFYVSTRSAAAKHRQVLQLVIEEIEKTEQWMRAHPDDAARQLAEATGLPLNIWQTCLSRHYYGIKPIDEKVIDSQQRIADTFYSLGLLPAKENVASAVWQPIIK